MTTRKANLLNIVISLLFAAAILFSGFLLEGSEHKQTMTYLLLALWFIPFSFLSGFAAKKKM